MSNVRKKYVPANNNNLHFNKTSQNQIDVSNKNLLKQKDLNKEYLKNIQEEIDILENKLFSNDEPEEFELFQDQQQSFQLSTNIKNYENTNEPILNVNIHNNNVIHNIPHKVTIDSIQTEETKQEQNNNDNRDELYQMVLHERKKCNELENRRNEQNLKLKELNMKYNELSSRNEELSNTVELLQQEKEKQLSIITDLQNQLLLLQKEKYNNCYFTSKKI